MASKLKRSLSAHPTLDKKHLSKAVLEAAHRAGSQFGSEGLISYLEAQALATPSPFLTLLARAIYDQEEADFSDIKAIEIIAPASKAPALAPAAQAASGAKNHDKAK